MTGTPAPELCKTCDHFNYWSVIHHCTFGDDIVPRADGTCVRYALKDGAG